jgi:predicted DNA-binding protein (MmcQ/YjbR family)
MDLLKIREYCLSKPLTSEEFPFDDVTLVFKVYGKMFALLDLEAIPLRMNLKCEPTKAILLREEFDFITPGYHMNKRHWNTITLGDKLQEDFLCQLIDHSYYEVVRGLPKKVQQQIFEQDSQ